VDYIPLLKALDASCRALGFDHVVLSDHRTAPALAAGNMVVSAEDLPRRLSLALTEAQARYLERAIGYAGDSLFVGADCLIARDFRDHLAPADLSIILRPGHKRHRINNGFMYVPAASVVRVAPLFRKIADDTGPTFNRCHDMEAVERALSPMPMEYGMQERAGLTVNFLPMDIWNGGPKTAGDPASDAFVLHFRGKARKKIMLDWARRWLRDAA
jgi:hypothetical protein